MNKQPRLLCIITNLMRSLRHSFQAKIMLVTVGVVLLGTLLTAAISFIGTDRLADNAIAEIEAGLGAANREYLEHHIEDTAARVNLWMGHAQADLRILADITQKLIDNRDEFRPLVEVVTQLPFFEDKMQYYPEDRWWQNASDEPTVINIPAFLLDDQFQINLYPQQIMDETAILDLIMPSIHTYGAEKINTYFVGDREADFMRMAPWVDLGPETVKSYPEHTDTPYWSYAPGLVETWESWLENPDSARDRPSDITAIPPARSGATGGIAVTQNFVHPLWNKERTKFAGAVWYDLDLNEIVAFIEDIRLAETGFAFIAQSDGNVFGIPQRGVQITGLQEIEYRDAVLWQYCLLQNSSESAIAALTLPQDDKVYFSEIELGGKKYIVMMHSLAPMNLWTPDRGMSLEHWALGFVVPWDELHAPLIAAQESISKSSRDILIGQVAVLIATISILTVLLYFTTRRMTAGLVSLSDSTRQIVQGNYDVRVTIQSGDEVGRLGGAFNEMAHQLKQSVAQIQEHAQQVQQIIDTVPEGVLLLDSAGRIILVNPMAKKDLSVLAGVRVGDSLTRLGNFPLVELLTSPPKGLWHEVEVNGAATRNFEVIARPIEPGPANGGWVLVIRDVTHEREIQRRAQQQDRLAAVGQLAAGIAHDFNNIVSVIVLYSHIILKMSDLPPEVQKRLKTISQQALRATDLIEQILDFSRRSVMERQLMNLVPFLKEQVKLLERTLPENIHIDLGYGTDEYMVNADPTRIQQAIMNLAVNARDAMPDGGGTAHRPGAYMGRGEQNGTIV